MFLLCIDWRHESETEQIMNFVLLEIVISLRANRMARAPAVKIEACRGRLRVAASSPKIALDATLTPSLEPSV